MIPVEDVEKLLADAARTLVSALESRPGQHDYVASSPAGGQFVLVRIDGVCDAEEHSHEYNEYCMVLKGRCTAWIRDEAIILGPGDFLFEPANVPHRAHIEGPYVAIDFFAGPRFETEEKKSTEEY